MTIWISRTLPDAAETACSVQRLGYRTLLLPALQIVALPSARPRRKAYDGIVFTSRQAVRRFGEDNGCHDLPVYAVGDRTAELAVAVGFRNVVSAGGDVHDLRRLLLMRVPTGSHLLHPCALSPAGDLPAELESAGICLEHLPVYRSVPTPLEHLQGRVGHDKLDGVMVHSPLAAKVVAAFLSTTRQKRRLPIFCISQAAARPFRDAPALDLRVARRPDEHHLLALLTRPSAEGHSA